MRVCHVVEAGGGVGNVVLDLLRAGIEAGDDVTLIYAPNRQWPSFLVSLNSIKGVKTIPLSMQREVGLHDMMDCIHLYNGLRRAGPFDIIHAHSSKAGALTRIIRPFFPKSRVIYTPHAFMTMAPGASRIYGWIERLLSHFCDAIICVSGQEKRHALGLGIAEKKLHVIPNGVRFDYPVSRLMARTKMGYTDKDFVVGFVGRLVPQKNPARMVEAFASAAKQKTELRLAIIGYGPLQHETEQALDAHGMRDRVCFLEDYNGRDYMPGFDCLLCSSDYESFGLVILEALAAGVPVVTTPVGVAEEAVVPGKNGFIAGHFEAQALGNSIAALATINAAAREAMAIEAKACAQNFSISAMSNATRHLYAKMLGR